jgi:hypothetical protein
MDTRIRGNVLKWELWGIVFVLLLGALWHFVFQLTGDNKVVGAFAPVNESVWEHFKLGFWPMIIYALIEYKYIGWRTNSFFIAKTAALYIIPVIIGLVFYSYTAVIGHSILAIDIATFAVAVAIGQLISFKIMTYDELPQYLNYISLAFVVLLAALFAFFTFYPPELSIFLDGTGFYGIP